jgi:hypothetical protein
MSATAACPRTPPQAAIARANWDTVSKVKPRLP